MLESLQQLDEKILESFQITTSGGNHYSNLITANGNPVRVIFNQFLEDTEKELPCMLIVRKDISLHFARIDSGDWYEEDVDYDVDPPVVTISGKPQPYTILYEFHFISKKVSEQNDMIFSFMTAFNLSDYLEITEEYSVYFVRNEVYTNLNTGYKDQRFRNSLFQIKYWVLLKSSRTRTDILITEVDQSIGEL